MKKSVLALSIAAIAEGLPNSIASQVHSSLYLLRNELHFSYPGPRMQSWLNCLLKGHP